MLCSAAFYFAETVLRTSTGEMTDGQTVIAQALVFDYS